MGLSHTELSALQRGGGADGDEGVFNGNERNETKDI